MKEKTKTITKTLSLALGAIFVFGAVFLVNTAVSHASLGKSEISAPKYDYSALIGNGESHGVKLMAARLNATATQANEDTYLLTATVTPSTASCALDWSAEWRDANSTWANGKSVSEYVTVTPTSNGALTANVTCLKGFSEEIVIKATARSDSSVFATCTVNYQSRNTWLEFQLVSTKYPEINVSFGMDKEDDVVNLILPTGDTQAQFLVNDLRGQSDYQIRNTINASGAYTTLDTIESYNFSMKPSQQFLTAANEVGLPCNLSVNEYVTLTSLRYGEIIEKLTNNNIFGEGYFVEGIYDQFIAACRKTTLYDFDLKITTVCKSGRTKEYVLSCHFANSNFPSVEKIILDHDNILF